VHAGGAAAKTKRIREGDRILAVNDIPLENIPHEEVYISFTYLVGWPRKLY